jgi:hypothetical protein
MQKRRWWVLVESTFGRIKECGFDDDNEYDGVDG